MGKVTYLFGAGASYGTLPIIKEIKPKLLEFKNTLSLYESILPTPNFPISSSKSHTILWKDAYDDLFKTIDLVIEGCDKHESIDIFAKKLYITRSPNYPRLKILMCIFFIFLQCDNEPNKRYDTFFASILGHDSTDFLGDISILTWNYDSQFEIAYSKYSKLDNFDQNQFNLRLTPPVRFDAYKNGFSIIKLNGSAAVYTKGKHGHDYQHIPEKIDQRINNEFVGNLFTIYGNYVFGGDIHRSALTFAWETKTVEFIKNIIPRVTGSSALVVIGYSFPFFNREIDQAIFSSLNKTARIYVQNPEADEISDRAKAYVVYSQTVIPYKDYKQFLLPSEL